MRGFHKLSNVGKISFISALIGGLALLALCVFYLVGYLFTPIFYTRYDGIVSSVSCVQECRLGETNPCNLNSNVILSGTHYEQDISITYYAGGNKQIANLSVRPESKYGYNIGQNVSVLVNGTVVKLEVDSSARDLIILALATTGYWIISVLLLREVKKTIAED